MAMVRPSLILQALLTSKDYSELSVREVKRSYIYIAQTDVRQLPEQEDAEGNIMRLCIRLMKPYWDISDPEARSLWDGMMPHWLNNISRNLSTAMRAYNTVLHPFGIGRIVYQWADFEFDDNATLRVKLVGNAITADLPDMVAHARKLLCEGAFGEGEIARIRIPSAASCQAQFDAGTVEAYEAETEEYEDAPEAQEASEEFLEAADGAEDGTLETVTLAAEAADAALVDGGEAPVEAEPESPEAKEDAGEDAGVLQAGGDGAAESDAAFEEQSEEDGESAGQSAEDEQKGLPDSRLSAESMDFAIWGIEYADGTVREFDSIRDEFV